MPDFQEFLELALQKTIKTHKYFNNEYSFQIELIVQMRFLTDSNSKFSGFYVVPEYSNKDAIDKGGIGVRGRLDILVRNENNEFCVIELKHKCRANSCDIPLNGSGNLTLKIRGGDHTNWNNSGNHKGGFSQIQNDIIRCQWLKNNKIVTKAYLVLFSDYEAYTNRTPNSDQGKRWKDKISGNFKIKELKNFCPPLKCANGCDYQIITFEIDP